MVLFIAAQIMGIGALILLLLSFNKNDKKTLLKFQIISSLFYAIQYIFLAAFTGFYMNMICLIRNVIFSKYDDNNKVPIIWLIIVLIVIVILGIYSYDGPISLFPTIGVFIYSISLWQKNLKITRLGEIIACMLVIVYNIKYKAIAGLISTSIEICIVFSAIYRFDIRKPKLIDSNNN